MKPVKLAAIGIAAVAFSLFTAAFASRNTPDKEQDRAVQGKGFAVLELFTSEGCSSCPPADALLARIQKAAGDQPVYILAYHVDYWNRLGWKDIFSKAEYSKRQNQYSRQLGAQVYTPQLIINGKSEYIGSDEAAVREAIKGALNGSSQLSLNIKGQFEPGKVQLHYQVTGKAGNSQLLVALIEKHATSQVKRGENEGRTLAHVQIVNDLHVFSLQSGNEGSEQINLPAAFNPQDWELIGMLQDEQTGSIEAAGHVSLSPSTGTTTGNY